MRTHGTPGTIDGFSPGGDDAECVTVNRMPTDRQRQREANATRPGDGPVRPGI